MMRHDYIDGKQCRYDWHCLGTALKKLLVGMLVTPILLLMVAAMAGYPPRYLLAAPSVATGIGSKLLCSAHYVSSFSEQQAYSDLLQYSPFLSQLDIDFDQSRRTVTTSFFGLDSAVAEYVDGLGCALEFPGYRQRYSIPAEVTIKSTAAWPAGSYVGEPEYEIQNLLDEMVARDNLAGLNTRALLVVHRERILAETYAQGVDAGTPVLGWSMAKSLMSVMLGSLAYRGKLDFAAAPGFSEWQSDEREEITILDMLTMSDGLEFSEEYDPGDDATAMLFTEPSGAAYVLNQQLVNEPGQVFNYSSGTTTLLSLIYQQANGGPVAAYQDYMRYIHKPLGFQNAVFEMDAAGTFVGSSYFYASARDWARLGQLMLNRGAINGRRIVSEEWIDSAMSPNNTINDRAYGFQWWLNHGNPEVEWPALPEDTISAQGNRQQYLVVIPSLELVIVRLGWTAETYPINERFAEIVGALN